MITEGCIVKIISKDIYGVASYNSRISPNIWTVWTEDGYVVVPDNDLESIEIDEESSECIEG